MEFMGIGPMELLVIFIIALIVFGPNRLPEIGAQLGKFMRNMKRAAFEMTRELNKEIEESKKSVAPAAEEVKAVIKTASAVIDDEPEQKEKAPTITATAQVNRPLPGPGLETISNTAAGQGPKEKLPAAATATVSPPAASMSSAIAAGTDSGKPAPVPSGRDL